jgi:molecular chaperone GrpE
MEKKVTSDTTHDNRQAKSATDGPQPGSETWPTASNGPDTREPAETTAAEQLLVLQEERDNLIDQLQRSRAEFINYRRRTDQERAMVRTVVTRDVLAQFLPIVDDFQRALGAIPAEEREKGWEKGIELIASKLRGVLDRAGVKEIDALHQPFDPARHEAVATEPGSQGTHVVEVYQTGYTMGDDLMRPAMVKTGDVAEHHRAPHEKTTHAHRKHPHTQA